MREATDSHHRLVVGLEVLGAGKLGPGSRVLCHHEKRKDHSARGQVATWCRSDCTVGSPYR